MKTSRLGWGLLALLLAGCPQGDDDDTANGDDDTAPEPSECGNFGLENILYDFTILDPEDALGYGEPETDAEWWTELAEQVAIAYPNYRVLSLGLDLVVADHAPDGDGQMLALEYQYDGETLLWVDFWYHLPLGATIPALPGDTIGWYYVWNFASLEYPATAPMIYDASGQLLFYGEPGANGITFNNHPDYPDTANPLFSSIAPVDHDCSANLSIECGEQYNLQLQFLGWADQVLTLWPGETSTFVYVNEDETTRDFEVTSVWSYDWRDTSCSGAQYERNYAFFVLASE